MSYRKLGAVATAMALLLMAGFAWAGLGDHATDVGGNNCAACHNVQASAALRGWGSSLAGVPTVNWYSRTITKLCWSCHQAGSPTGAHDVTRTAMADEQASGAHMYTPGSVWAIDGSAQENYSGTGLPYTRLNGPIECTTCHNVHNDDYAPFLNRPSMGGANGICVTCHLRYNDDPASVADNNQGGTGGRSLHPTNVALADNGNNGVTFFENPIDARLRVPIPGLQNAGWTLGGHLTTVQEGTAGFISCQTCHAVHGTDTLTGVEDLLAIPNNYNVAGQPSALCEGCHGGPAGAAVNPVGTGSDHPINNDAGRPFYPTGVTMPALWLDTTDHDTAASPFWGGTPPASNAPVCSSCHDTHGGFTTTSLWRSPITGNDKTMWCFECHTASQLIPPFHHSNIHNDQDGGDFSALDCGDCHGNIGSGYWRAHNGFWDFRADPDEVNPTGTVYQSLCESCHEPLNPTSTSYGSAMPATHGNASGTDSHTVSDYGNSDYVHDDETTFNSFIRGTPVWPQSGVRSKVGAFAAGYSGWNLICESCHNIVANCAITVAAGDPDGGGWKTNLLLDAYEDDEPGTTTGVESPNNVAGQTGDALCRGCHYTGASQDAPNPGSYVHYPAAHTVQGFNYALEEAPYGRATLAILTGGACNEQTTADMAGAPGVMSYPAADSLNCDTCHRPHNADPDGPTGGFGHVILENGSTAGMPKTDACDQCHDTQTQCGQ